MSDTESKDKHSLRLHRDEVAIKKQVGIAKKNGMKVDQPHKFAKHHAMDCGNPGCPVCSNPRKLRGERTIQEKKFYQRELYDETEVPKSVHGNSEDIW